MDVRIRTVKPSGQRYPTVGDWRGKTIKVSEMGDWRYELLVAVHELIEMRLCEERGVKEADVTEFDVTHPDLVEPGDSPDAPYHKEHMFATIVEKFLAAGLGVDWEAYELAVLEAVEKAGGTVVPMPPRGMVDLVGTDGRPLGLRAE